MLQTPVFPVSIWDGIINTNRLDRNEDQEPDSKDYDAISAELIATQDEVHRLIVAGGLHWTGPWSPITAYLTHDAVSYLGSSYVALSNNTNSTPPSANWDLLAARGVQGPQGDIGPEGPDGPQGTQGTQGDLGVQGDAGVPGPQGDIGSQGVAGAQGADGAQGTQGAQGGGGGGSDTLTTLTGGTTFTSETTKNFSLVAPKDNNLVAFLRLFVNADPGIEFLQTARLILYSTPTRLDSDLLFAVDITLVYTYLTVAANPSDMSIAVTTTTGFNKTELLCIDSGVNELRRVSTVGVGTLNLISPMLYAHTLNAGVARIIEAGGFVLTDKTANKTIYATLTFTSPVTASIALELDLL
jgi:hypothetical protein